MVQLFIHIGLHKTGTTFLQRAVFPALDDVTSFGGRQSLRSVLTTSADEKVLISDEGLSGQFFGGKWLVEFETNIDIINNLFPAAAVIIGFRRQDSLLLSLYKQYIQEGGTEKLEYLFEPFSDTGLIKTHELYFKNRIKYLDKHFNNIFIYTQEELRDNFDEFLQDLASFMEVQIPTPNDINDSDRNVGIRGLRQFNLLIRLNRINNILEKTHYLPTLNNRLFKDLGISPRYLCQYRFTSVRSEPLKLPEKIEKFLISEYDNDWKYVEYRRKTRLQYSEVSQNTL